MYSRIICVSILVISTLGYDISDRNVTKDTKSKRGVQGIADPGEISVLPPQHIGTYTQIRTIQQDETPYVDLTYKSLEGGLQNQYVSLSGEQPKFSTDNTFEAQTYQPQQLNYEALLQNPHQFFQPQALQNVPVYATPITLPPQPNAAAQYFSTPYPITFDNKLAASLSPLSPYATQKSLSIPGHLKRNNPLKLPSYNSPVAAYPALYGAANVGSSLKLYQPNSLQYNLPVQGHTYQQPIKYIQPYHTKIPYKLNSQPQYRPAHITNPQLHSSPILQISHNFKALEPNFYEQQPYNSPAGPQLQPFIPSQQYETFKPVQQSNQNNNNGPSSQIKSQNSQRGKDDSREDEDDEDVEDDDDEIANRKGSSENDDEEHFEKGYRDASKGFPGHDCQHDDDGRYNNYRSGRQRNVDYDDDNDYNRRPPYNNYDDDTEGHYSDKHQKKEPKHQGHSHRESYKYSKKGETHKKPYKQQYEKKYKSSRGSSQRQKSDSKYASNTLKSQNVQAPLLRTFPKQNSAPIAVKVAVKSSTEPSYQSGFEPMKSPYVLTAHRVEDQEGKHSSNRPVVKNKVYREDTSWFVSKSTAA